MKGAVRSRVDEGCCEGPACERWMEGAVRCALDEGFYATSITLDVEWRCTMCVAFGARWMKGALRYILPRMKGVVRCEGPV